MGRIPGVCRIVSRPDRGSCSGRYTPLYKTSLGVSLNVAAKTLYKTVGQLGLTRAQVRRLLPEWWEPDLEIEPDYAAELAVHLSRRLSIDLQSLLGGTVVPKGAVSNLAFKHRANVDAASLSAASFIASSLAQAILAALPMPYEPLPFDVKAVRDEACRLQDGPLGFDALVNLCWSHGIPVIPLPNLPVGVRKMDGAALQVGNRPVIVLAKKKSSRSWLSFILAHEMGHIVRGHLLPGSSIVDVSLQETVTYLTESSSDVQESEADEFALQTMGGVEVDQEISGWSANAAPVELAVSARRAGSRLNVEAGHFILRHAFATKRWPEAVLALRFLSEDFNPEAALIAQLKRRLDMELIADDLQDLVRQVTGWNNAV